VAWYRKRRDLQQEAGALNEAPTAERRELLLSGAALLASTAMPRPAIAQNAAIPIKESKMPPTTEYAVFTEFSPDTKPMKDGWNRRVFTDTDGRKGAAIQCDFMTGIVTLAPGIYHISGLSMVAYDSGGEPPEMTTIRAPASAGYCRLRTVDANAGVDSTSLRALDNDDPSAICIGSPSSANLVPSLFEAFYETDKTARLLLEHQSGSKPEQFYLRVFTQNSRWHAFARIAIRGL
jgi:hypothetical protein